MKYNEPQNMGNSYRIAYREDIEDFVVGLCRERREESLKNAKRFSESREEERKALINMLGWPLTEESNCVTAVKRELLTEEDGISVFRMTFNILGKIRYYGLLFQHSGNEKRPLVICQHGGLGTPELCSSLLESGSSNYNDMTQRVLSLGVDVFAPQMLLWDPAQYDEHTEDIKRRELDQRLRLCGGSIAALEIFCLKKSLDCLCDIPTVASEHIGMVGLSYGGFYTLFTAAIDTRIKAAVSCSFFNDRDAYPWSDWVWNSKKNIFHDPEVAMLVYPRSLCIAVGSKDELFDIDTARSEIERFRLLSQTAYKSDNWFKAVEFDGAHEFIQTNDVLEWLKERL